MVAVCCQLQNLSLSGSVQPEQPLLAGAGARGCCACANGHGELHQPLPDCVRPEQALLAGAGEAGAVYVSMGTLCNFGREEFAAIAAALGELRHAVVWKLAPGDLPGNATVDSLGLAPNVKARAHTPLMHAPSAPSSPLPSSVVCRVQGLLGFKHF